MNKEELKQFVKIIEALKGSLNTGSIRFLKTSKETILEEYTTADTLKLIYEDSKTVALSKHSNVKEVSRVHTNYINLNVDIEKQLLKKADFFDKDSNLYFTPQIFDFKGSRNKGNVWYLNTLYADLDNVSVEEAESRLNNSNLPQPSLKILSGNGVHYYWILGFKANKNDWEKTWLSVQDYISTQLNSDKQVNEIARVMRIPLSFNNKEDKKKVEIIEENLSKTYNLQKDFYDVYIKKDLPKVKEEEVKSTVESTKKAQKLVKKESAEVKEEEVKKTVESTKKVKKTKRINHYSKYIREDIQKVIETRIQQGFNWKGMRNTTLVVLKSMNFSDEYMINLNNTVFNLSEDELRNVLNWETSNKFMKRKNIYEKLQITEEEEQGLKVLRNKAEVFLRAELKELESMSNKVFKDYKEYLIANYVKNSNKKQKELGKEWDVSDREVRRLKKVETADKNEMISSLLKINEKTLDLIEYLRKEEGTVSKENELRLKKLVKKLEDIELMLKDNEEINAKNKFKVRVLKSKYNELIELIEEEKVA